MELVVHVEERAEHVAVECGDAGGGKSVLIGPRLRSAPALLTVTVTQPNRATTCFDKIEASSWLRPEAMMIAPPGLLPFGYDVLALVGSTLQATFHTRSTWNFTAARTAQFCHVRSQRRLMAASHQAASSLGDIRPGCSRCGNVLPLGSQFHRR